MLSFDIEQAIVFIEKIAMDSMKSMAVYVINAAESVTSSSVYVHIQLLNCR